MHPLTCPIGCPGATQRRRLAGAVSISLVILLGWHVYLVLTGQTTIDVYQNRERAAEARRRGQKFVNAFDLGFKRNWQECFDVHGRWWWLTWMLPPIKPKLGDGVIHPTIYHERDSEGQPPAGSLPEMEDTRHNL